VGLGAGVLDTDGEKLDCFGILIFKTSEVLALVGKMAAEARPLTIDSSCGRTSEEGGILTLLCLLAFF
jgi:hypothetical protein